MVTIARGLENTLMKNLNSIGISKRAISSDQDDHMSSDEEDNGSPVVYSGRLSGFKSVLKKDNASGDRFSNFSGYGILFRTQGDDYLVFGKIDSLEEELDKSGTKYLASKNIIGLEKDNTWIIHPSDSKKSALYVQPLREIPLSEEKVNLDRKGNWMINNSNNRFNYKYMSSSANPYLFTQGAYEKLKEVISNQGSIKISDEESITFTDQKPDSSLIQDTSKPGDSGSKNKNADNPDKPKSKSKKNKNGLPDLSASLYETLKARVDAHDKKFTDLEDELKSVKAENNDLKRDYETLTSRINNLGGNQNSNASCSFHTPDSDVIDDQPQSPRIMHNERVVVSKELVPVYSSTYVDRNGSNKPVPINFKLTSNKYIKVGEPNGNGSDKEEENKKITILLSS